MFIASLSAGMPVLYRWQALTRAFLPTRLPIPNNEELALVPRHIEMSAVIAVFDATGAFIFMGDASGNLYLLSSTNLSCLQVYKSQPSFSFKDLSVHPGGT